MILKKIVCSAVLAMCPLMGAQAGAWSFTYEGFFDSQTQAFDPYHVLAGYFEGTDLNGNGSIDTAELSQLRLDGRSYFGCDAPTTCVIGSFGYVPGQPLSFTVARFTRDDIGVASEVIVAGDSISYTSSDHNYMPVWSWTDATVFQIAPVPEPASIAMLGAGLLILSACRRRQRRA